MKKSEQYHAAMCAVLAFDGFDNDEILEILETLMADRRAAVYSEELAAKEAASK